MTVREYNRHVWDMAKHQLHPTGIYVVLAVLGTTHLSANPWFREPGIGWWRELGAFGLGFLGAWAVLYSTLLRVAGLKSLTVTFLVPYTLLALLYVYFAMPDPKLQTLSELSLSVGVLLGPAVPVWGATMWRWQQAKRETAHLRRPNWETDS